MRSLKSPRLLLAVLAAALTLTASAAVPELPPRVVAPTDSAVFRRFTLDNGLRVLLVSDPKFNKSGAALAVNTGQIDDPADREGLAHFLEHMLFLGTEKYPEVADYGNFIKSNGGYNNAYTTSDHTNYQFEVRHAAFADALDRFAQFFIAPRFNPDFTSREVNAVHNEAMRHVQNDQRRLIGVSRELYTPGSGESKFSTGTKETLAGATPEAVRAFYETHYTADRMALALAGKASLDELEKLARTLFAAIPRRAVTPPVREPVFLPHKAALRLALAEPIKELRQLNLEFVIPATRPDFASKPDELVTQLISYPGPGGLVELLKREGLINALDAGTWERTSEYGSFIMTADLTPAGQVQKDRVLQLIFSYLNYLRAAPFPADFYRDRARIAALNETYRDRGEGAALATQLANQALFYPLAIAERAAAVWGAPDEAAYRHLLAVLTPDNLLAALMAKGVPTDRKERIYGTAYSYSEDTGAAYAALVNPPKADFALPGANPFMPGETSLLAERPLPLISEPGLQLYYAPDTEFQRPQTTLVLRFVPVRTIASADATALLRLYDLCLRDALEPALGDAALAGLDYTASVSLEGLSLTVSGFGDSPVRFATYVAGQLRGFTVTPERFASLKEVALRGLRSYEQTEAYTLARDRRDALSREFQFLPDELIPRTTIATWAEVQALAAQFFARGKLEAVVHGHLAPEAAVTATRAIAGLIGAAATPESELLRRRHLVIAPAENVVDAGSIAGVNSAFVRDYLLPDDSPATRAAAVVVANFFSEPFYTELRTKQQLGYIVGSAGAASLRQRYFTFVVQSSGYAPDELQSRAETFIATLPAALAAVTDAQWTTLIAGARSALEEKPKSIAEKAGQFFASAYVYDGEWDRRQAALKALDALTREQAVALLQTALDPATARRRTLLLNSSNHPPATPVVPTFTDRNGWKSTRQFN
ncbi:MAG: insulinase family protein [Opitutaceae bacterium]|nr:insulinase family protein [Opitutaceae bacterium]